MVDIKNFKDIFTDINKFWVGLQKALKEPSNVCKSFQSAYQDLKKCFKFFGIFFV